MMTCNKKIILGLAGEMACGKGTTAGYVKEKYSGSSHRFSTMLRDVLNRLYLENNRENMSKISTLLRQNFGEDLMANVIFNDVKNDSNNIVVIDGVRRLADIKYLQQLPEFKFIYIEADIEKRFERITKRGENVDDNSKTFEEFKKNHQLETELQILGLKNSADYVINNNGNLEELCSQIDKIIDQLCV